MPRPSEQRLQNVCLCLGVADLLRGGSMRRSGRGRRHLEKKQKTSWRPWVMLVYISAFDINTFIQNDIECFRRRFWRGEKIMERMRIWSRFELAIIDCYRLQNNLLLEIQIYTFRFSWRIVFLRFISLVVYISVRRERSSLNSVYLIHQEIILQERDF